MHARREAQALNPREFCFRCMNRLPAPDEVCPRCGWNNQDRRNGEGELPFASLAHKYIIGKALGRGGFGITYVGLNIALGTRVAIKEYFPAEISRRADNGADIVASAPEYEELYNRGKQKALTEAQVIAGVQDVRDVVRIYNVMGRNNTVYIIMEYVEGETLASLVSRKGALRWAETAPLFKPIGLALDQLHRKNLVHRDVSPDNLMIRADNGRAVLLDFGAATGAIAEGEQREKNLKEGYAAPEQYQEQAAIDGRADEYSLGATLYFALAGERPASATQRKFGDGALDFSRKRDFPAAVKEAITRSMAIDPEERYPTVGEMVSALEAAPVKERSLQPEVGKKRPAGAKTKPEKSPWRIAALVAAILAGIFLLGMVGVGLLT